MAERPQAAAPSLLLPALAIEMMMGYL